MDIMVVVVKLFAAARQSVGADQIALEIPEAIEPTTVAAVRQALEAHEPDLAGLLAASRIAVDGEFADDATAIHPGAEIALIPPVSGGSVDMADMIQITEDVIDHANVTESVRTPRAGAVCSFLGTVREFTGTRQTVRLDYEAYVPMAERQIAVIVEESRRRWPLERVAVVHRIGALELGQISVIVAVSSPHRREAFEACAWIMDTLKRDVPIWKRETWADGSQQWSHPDSTLGAP